MLISWRVSVISNSCLQPLNLLASRLLQVLPIESRQGTTAFVMQSKAAFSLLVCLSFDLILGSCVPEVAFRLFQRTLLDRLLNLRDINFS